MGEKSMNAVNPMADVAAMAGNNNSLLELLL